MKAKKARAALLLVMLLLLAPLTTSWADSPTLNAATGGTAHVITPVITPGAVGNHAAITPVEVASMFYVSNGIVTTIRRSDLSAFVAEYNISEVELLTGLGATGYVGANVAPQVLLTDDNGQTAFAVYASGGQLRMDKKMSGGALNGRYSVTKSKATAIDFVDLRLQFKFVLPQGVSIQNTAWSWNLRYGSVNKTVHGVNYLPVTGQPNTYTSNVVITNIPISSCQDMNFRAGITLSYVLDGVTYTVTQPSVWQLGRTIKALTNQYRSMGDLDSATQAYINAVYNQMEQGVYTPVA